MSEIDFEPRAEAARAVQAALRGLRFGSVEIVVHDGRVVQLERRERVRPGQPDLRRPDHRRPTSAKLAQANRSSGSRGREEIP